MTYVDAINDQKKDKIVVVERTKSGERVYKEYPANYLFYYEDRKGKHRTIYGTPVSKFSTNKKKEFDKERRMYFGKPLYESDVNIVFRCLSDHYQGTEAPNLHTCFFDIESNFKPNEVDEDAIVKVRLIEDMVEQTMNVKQLRKLSNPDDYQVWDGRLKAWVKIAHSTFVIRGSNSGFAPTDDPFNEVTAITVYLDWLDQLVTLVMPPPHLDDETVNEMTANFENCFIFRDEVELFNTFFLLIEDADIMTGWNSEGYDIPYLVNRVRRIMSKDDTRRFCLLNQFPKTRLYERYGKEEETYDLVGRVHMDYLQLYKKYNYESRHSYSLDAIGEMEVNEHKTKYEGSLDQLYNRDFKTFVEYNRQDVMLMVKIHRKLKFLDLANALAHENSVLLPTVMGSVAMIEMAIMNFAHKRNMVLPDKKSKDENVRAWPVAGAFVANPKKGLHEYTGAVDINSLYPSDIRALNMSPETIFAQIRPTLTDVYMTSRRAELLAGKKNKKKKKFNINDTIDDIDENDEEQYGAYLWEGLFGTLEYTAVMEQERDTILTVDYADGRSVEMSAAQIWKMVFDSHNPYILSANGTIFTVEKEGLIPGLLSSWYAERQEIQKHAKGIYAIRQGIEIPHDMAAKLAEMLGDINGS